MNIELTNTWPVVVSIVITEDEWMGRTPSGQIFLVSEKIADAQDALEYALKLGDYQ